MRKRNVNLAPVVLVLCGLVVAFWEGCGKGPTGDDDNPQLTVTPDTLDFGDSRNSLSLTIGNAGTGILDWRIQAPSEEWISVSQSKGSIVNNDSSPIDVRLDRDKAPPGQHELTLMVTGGGGQQEVSVRATILDQSPILKVDPVSLDFGESSNSMVLTVSNAGGGTLHWTIAAPSEGWIELSQREGTTSTEPARVDVRIDREKAPAGRQQVTLVVTGEAGSRQEVALVATITRPVLAVSPGELHFDASAQSKLLVISNEGTGVLNWSIVASESWLQVNLQSGRTQTQASTVTVSVDRSRMETNGTYTGEVVVTSDGGTAVVPVSMVVEGMVSLNELRVSPVSLAFGETSTRKTIGISNGGVGAMSWQASSAQGWISVSPDSGSVAGGETAAQVIVEVDRSQTAPGEHKGSVDVISNGGSKSIPVTVSVPAPVLSLNARDLDFRTDLEVLSLEIANTGTGSLEWELGEELDWLEIQPAQGTTGQVAASVQFSVQRQHLAAGKYEGKVRLTSNSTAEPAVEVRVAMEVGEEPALAVMPEELEFGEEQSELTLDIKNANNGTLVWQAKKGEDWIELAQTEGKLGLLEEGSVAVRVSRQGLASGEYQGQMEFTSNGGNQKVPVRMAVPQAPVLVMDEQSLNFGVSAVTGMLMLRNAGTGRLSWNVGEEPGWLEVAPNQGTTLGEADTLVFTVNRARLDPGTYTGQVAVRSDGGEQEVVVEMQVAEAPMLGISADTLDFGNAGEALTLRISSEGNASLVWSLGEAADWLQASPGSGELAPGEETEVEVRVNREGLALGDYQAALTLDSNGGKRELRVSARVEAALLTVSMVELDFREKLGRMKLVLGNEGNVPLEWSAVEAMDWLELEVERGTVAPGGTREMEVRVNRADLEVGEYAGEVTIRSNDARGPVTLAVRMVALENNVPIADAGPDQTAVQGATVQLDGSGSADADGDELSYQWTAAGGIDLSDPTDARPRFTATAAGTYSFDLVVSDGQSDSEPDELLVTVVSNTAAAEITGEVVDGDTDDGGTADAEISGEVEEDDTTDAEISGEVVDGDTDGGDTADAEISGEVVDGDTDGGGTGDAEVTGEVKEISAEAEVTGETEK